MTHIAILPGDGVGPEVTSAGAQALEVLAPDLEHRYADIGLGAWERSGDALPPETLELVRSSRATLLGAVTTPPLVPGYRSPILGLRRSLDLWANIRPARSLPCASSRSGVDLIVVRENTEGLYSGVERREADTATTERVITRAASERILRRGFEIARDRGQRLTVVHKANVLRQTCGLFMEVAASVSEEFPEVAWEDCLVDSCATALVRTPESFGVLCTTNLFGDILSDLAAGLVGGLGVTASANLGSQYAVFEPVHGSAPDLAGTGQANPTATLLAVAMLLEHLGRRLEAIRLSAAVEATVASGDTTADLGGSLGTDEFTRGVLARLIGA